MLGTPTAPAPETAAALLDVTQVAELLNCSAIGTPRFAVQGVVRQPFGGGEWPRAAAGVTRL